jgi:hypothetical protein
VFGELALIGLGIRPAQFRTNDVLLGTSPPDTAPEGGLFTADPFQASFRYFLFYLHSVDNFEILIGYENAAQAFLVKETMRQLAFRLQEKGATREETGIAFSIRANCLAPRGRYGREVPVLWSSRAIVRSHLSILSLIFEKASRSSPTSLPCSFFCRRAGSIF